MILLNILMLEPYYTGSHANWINGYIKYSSHNVKVIGMKGRFWKWRMHGGAVYIAEEFLKSDFKPDLIVASDMMDLSTFISLCRHKLDGVKTALYFHENQLSYPWSPNDMDKKGGRDFHYGFINYSSALSADICLFNSKYHMESFLDSLETFLQRLPDYRGTANVDALRKKSQVLHLGLEYEKFDTAKLKYANDARPLEREISLGFPKKRNSEPALILWNHRWEYDKNPEDFFNALMLLSEKGINFNLAVLGESYKNVPGIFQKAKTSLGDKIVSFGKAESFSEYAKWLCKCDILPVTSNQEFFGISVMEAVYCGCYPILPNRLTYPELIGISENPHNFYSSFGELVEKLEWSIMNIETVRKQDMSQIAASFSWENMSQCYDLLFKEIL